MSKNYSNEKRKEKAFLFGVVFDNKIEVSAQLKELERLCDTAGVEVVGQDFQMLREINPTFLIGSGKVEELKEKVKDADVLVVDHELSGSQIRNLSDELNIKVIDRFNLILDIFATRAKSNEGKLQVELAQAKYFLPRLSSISGSSGRFSSGGVGTRGPGETKLELDKRHLEKRISYLEKQLNEIKKNREVKNRARYNSNKFSVAIVGYTNAGKSTLLNLLSKAEVYADDKLFATLETTSRKLFLKLGYEIILTDTVGFIEKLPHALMHAFASTLDEAKNADLILHVVDVSDSQRKQKMKVVNEVLNNIGAKAEILVVFNKCDKIHLLPDMDFDYVCISALKNSGIQELKAKILEKLEKLKI